MDGTGMENPEIDRTCALFLDLDGTLVEIAETPDAVAVPPDLPELLARLKELLGGAVATVSGRPIRDIDRLLAPFVASSSGEHGAAIRYPDGSLEEMRCDIAVPNEWKEMLAAQVARWPGALLEIKPHGVTLHYRQAAKHDKDVWKLARSLVSDDDPWFRLIPARMAVEIGLKATSKARAVQQLMTREPFRTRVPLFVGDDITDEAGMLAAREFGGRGLRVGEVFGGKPAEVRAWLRRGVDRLSKQEAA
jgi:trehalose 6-phosphate phosphatase